MDPLALEVRQDLLVQLDLLDLLVPLVHLAIHDPDLLDLRDLLDNQEMMDALDLRDLQALLDLQVKLDLLDLLAQEAKQDLEDHLVLMDRLVGFI